MFEVVDDLVYSIISKPKAYRSNYKRRGRFKICSGLLKLQYSIRYFPHGVFLYLLSRYFKIEEIHVNQRKKIRVVFTWYTGRP